jgi:hypothetical protein
MHCLMHSSGMRAYNADFRHLPAMHGARPPSVVHQLEDEGRLAAHQQLIETRCPRCSFTHPQERVEMELEKYWACNARPKRAVINSSHEYLACLTGTRRRFVCWSAGSRLRRRCTMRIVYLPHRRSYAIAKHRLSDKSNSAFAVRT